VKQKLKPSFGTRSRLVPLQLPLSGRFQTGIEPVQDAHKERLISEGSRAEARTKARTERLAHGFSPDRSQSRSRASAILGHESAKPRLKEKAEASQHIQIPVWVQTLPKGPRGVEPAAILARFARPVCTALFRGREVPASLPRLRRLIPTELGRVWAHLGMNRSCAQLGRPGTRRLFQVLSVFVRFVTVSTA